MFADLILPLPLPYLYTYRIPEDEKYCSVGSRVVVQFGKRKIYTGIVRNIHDIKPSYRTKDILSVLDEKPIVSELQLKFWDWISEYYMASLGDIYKAALPTGLKLESESEIKVKEDVKYEAQNDKEIIVINLIKNGQAKNLKQLESHCDFNPHSVVNRLVNKDVLIISEKLQRKYKAKFEKFIIIPKELDNSKKLSETLESLKKAPKQSALLMDILYLSKYGSDKLEGIKPFTEISKKDLLLHTNTSDAVLKALVEKEILIQSERETGRLVFTGNQDTHINELNEHQSKALTEIKQSFNEKDTVLLHGVTSSGKTEVYIKLIEEVIKQGKQVLYLLPEIALTSQIINRLKIAFEDKVGIYHSKFSDAERVEVWKNLNKEGASYQIILGVRSSIFLPFKNLGLIIVDEEHENTYKQHNPSPRYNARDVSTVLAKLHNAKVLLGTATPSVESYFNALTGKYALVEMKNRYQNIKLPEIIIADIKQARKQKKMRSIFALQLIDEIEKALQNKEQVILFKNRRGYSPVMECQTCGWVPKCEHCDVSLTYHKHRDFLVCHYCGYSYKRPVNCMACGSVELDSKGFGTEMIEAEIKQLFPHAKTARMDLDTTGGKKSYINIISEFENGNTDILIGTQMISKGLDFDKVSVVGILDADRMMNFPDFRAYERSWQMMIQVSGRAGRKNKQGKVVIQTLEKNHEVISHIIDRDIDSFYKKQLTERKAFKYPPYYRLIEISVRHKDYKVLGRAADLLAHNLRQIFGNRILGPEYPLIPRIKNVYTKTILIKIDKSLNIKEQKRRIFPAVDHVLADKNHKMVKVVFNVDPM